MECMHSINYRVFTHWRRRMSYNFDSCALISLVTQLDRKTSRDQSLEFIRMTVGLTRTCSEIVLYNACCTYIFDQSFTVQYVLLI